MCAEQRPPLATRSQPVIRFLIEFYATTLTAAYSTIPYPRNCENDRPKVVFDGLGGHRASRAFARPV